MSNSSTATENSVAGVAQILSQLHVVLQRLTPRVGALAAQLRAESTSTGATGAESRAAVTDLAQSTSQAMRRLAGPPLGQLWRTLSAVRMGNSPGEATVNPQHAWSAGPAQVQLHFGAAPVAAPVSGAGGQQQQQPQQPGQQADVSAQQGG